MIRNIQQSGEIYFGTTGEIYFGIDNFQTRSICAVLAFRVDGRICASTFAHGWMYLNEAVLETDFGLRVALNSLDEKNLKRLERTNLADAMRGVALSPFQRDFSSFGFDDALDLVRRLSGSTREDSRAEMISGARSLQSTGDFNLSELPQLAAEAIAFFQSNRYRTTSFRIIDFVRPITDHELISTLNELAAEKIREREENFELGLPATSEIEGVGYKFLGPRLRHFFPDLLLRNYINAMGTRLQDIDAQTLRQHKVVAMFEDGSRPNQSWSIHSALVGSIVYKESRYAVNEGQWYCIDDNFREAIEESFSRVVKGWEERSPAPPRKLNSNGKSARFETEATYNERLCAEHGFVHLDQKLIDLPDVRGSRFEACDALDISRKRFIHIKKSSRRSSVLSHFLKQGSNSAQRFKRYTATWNQLLSKVEEIEGSDTRQQLNIAIKDESRKWTVEFWIIDVKRQNGEFNIPFFSKISLRDEVRGLQAMGYEVCVRFIEVLPERI
ncbi:MAG: TIGR04141 family sporadically distributed protein [Gammaproteobacteria bacterium]|nr:TIGR04141 family sporadically distributed protein [Gammaproteobacteria bacterium]